MRIVGTDVIPYALPFREPYVTARRRLERREMVLVRLRTDGDIEGLGEAVPLSLRGGVALAEVERELRAAAEALVGDDLDASPSVEAPGRGSLPGGISRPAAAAIEMARLDLASKRAGVPAWRLLGAPAARPVPCNASLVAGPPAAVAAEAERWAARGFTTFKLKVGVPGDVSQVEAVRRAVGRPARIRVDANGAWSPEAAILRLTAMERHGIELAEQPAPELEDLAVVRGQTAIPLAADESVATPDDARRAVALGACQLATVKLAKVGGIDAARRIAAELPAYLSSALDGPLGIAAAAHAAQAVAPRDGWPDLAHGLATQLLFADTIASRECEVRDGTLHVPDGPGLGVTIDPASLERHRL